MKIILTLEFPPEICLKEKITIEQLQEAGLELEKELKQESPKGAIVSLKIQP